MNKKLTRAAVFLAALTVPALFSACDLFGGIASPETAGSPLVRFVEPVNGMIDLSLYAKDASRNAYVVFTTGKTNVRLVPKAVAAAGVPRPPLASTSSTTRNRGESASDARREAARARAASARPSLKPRMAISGGTPTGDYPNKPGSFKLVNDAGTAFAPVAATCRYASGSTGLGDPMEAVNFGSRQRTLSIWVANDCWDTLPVKKHKITQPMVIALAEAFFGKSISPTDSIYAWVTTMLGDEWGSHSATNIISGNTLSLIPPTGNITILLADISNDDSDAGGIVGYFYSVDTMQGEADSNERVMFTIDAVMYANPDDNGYGSSSPGYIAGEWSSSDYWAKEVFSTLAHEFQHMIHFYQKGVVRGGDYFSEPTWIDELCAMQVEDLLADKIGVVGPRGVEPLLGNAGTAGNGMGRVPDFLLYPDISLEDWGETDIYASYAIAYSFGAYLARNYGGANFIKAVVQSSAADETSIATAASAFSGKTESIQDLLRRWGAAVLLSARTDAPEYYRYNTGDFFNSTVDGAVYKQGSVNFYNYRIGVDTNSDSQIDAYYDKPYVFSATTIEDVTGGSFSNAFMDLGGPATKPSWTLTVPTGMYATIVID